ncbi:MAG: decarboxylase [Rhodospirillaceae bacterium]|nr:decarboxylase [Rhodospirillaceae bacterium]|tara:strand:- start:31523 stop:32065 length:543 start_codon:yes stop_codon:yes gene_type:complete
MTNSASEEGTPADCLTGSLIIDAVKKSGVNTILTVPDKTTSEGLLRPIAADEELRHIRVCKEDETVGISAAMSYSGQRTLILIQYTGLLDSMNAIRAIGCEYQMPICMMVGLLSKEPGVAPTESKRFGIRIVEPILDTMNIDRHLIETDDDIGLITPAINKCYETSSPVAMLIGRPPLAA